MQDEPGAMQFRGSTGVGGSIQAAASASFSYRKQVLESQETQARTELNLKRPKTSESSTEPDVNKEMLLKYINKVMSHSVRSYAIGWLIQNEEVRLVYGDRVGVVFTEEISFLQENTYMFPLILAAMGAASSRVLGVHPNIHYLREGEDDLAGCCNAFDVDHSYQGAVLRLDRRDDDGSETLEYDFDVDKKAGPTVHTEFGLIGRDTTVIPVKTRARVKEASSSTRAGDELAAKVAWPHAAQTGEDAFISKVRRCLKREGKTKMLQHIVDTKAALTKDAEAMELPRCSMGLWPGAQDLRLCRILILKRHRPLDSIGSQA